MITNRYHSEREAIDAVAQATQMHTRYAQHTWLRSIFRYFAEHIHAAGDVYTAGLFIDHHNDQRDDNDVHRMA